MSIIKSMTKEQKADLKRRAIKHLVDRGFCRSLQGSIAGCCATRYVCGHDTYENTFNPSFKRQRVSLRLRQSALVDAAVDIINRRIKETEQDGQSVLVATINSNQLIADRAFRKAGFKSTGWATRNPRNSPYRTKVKVFLKNVYQES